MVLHYTLTTGMTCTIIEILYGVSLHIYVPLVHGYTHFILLFSSLHGCSVHSYVMFTYHCYTCMHGYYMLVMWITVHIACHTHVFLSYGSPCILHVLLFHGTVFMLYDCFLLLIWIFLLLDMRAVDMRYVESHIYCSRFPLSCFVLSTELMLCYRVTCTLFCTCS